LRTLVGTPGHRRHPHPPQLRLRRTRPQNPELLTARRASPQHHLPIHPHPHPHRPRQQRRRQTLLRIRHHPPRTRKENSPQTPPPAHQRSPHRHPHPHTLPPHVTPLHSPISPRRPETLRRRHLR